MVRIKHRYLVVNILFPEPTTSNTQTDAPSTVSFRRPTPHHVTTPLLLAQIRSNLSVLFGDYGIGVASSSLKMVYFSGATSTFILRCPRAHFRMVWAALTFTERLPGPRRGEEGVSCAMRVVRVSGTIKKAEEDVMRRARREIVLVKEAMGQDSADGRGELLARLLGDGKEGQHDDQGIEDLCSDDEVLEDMSDEE